MALPLFRFHPLSGDRRGTYPVTVKANWRVTFRFQEGGVHGVNLEDLTEGAKALGVTRLALKRVINRKAGVSPEMALRLEKAIGSSAVFWFRLQLNHDLAQIQTRSGRIHVRRLGTPAQLALCQDGSRVTSPNPPDPQAASRSSLAAARHPLAAPPATAKTGNAPAGRRRLTPPATGALPARS